MKSREASGSALPARAACRGDGVQKSGRYLRVHLRGVSTAESRAYAVRALASALEACSPAMEASWLAS